MRPLAYGYLRRDTPVDQAARYDDDMRNLALRKGFDYRYPVRDSPRAWGVAGSGLPANLRGLFGPADVGAVLAPSLDHLHGWIEDWCEYVAVWTVNPERCWPYAGGECAEDVSRQAGQLARIAGSEALRPVAYAYLRSDEAPKVAEALEGIELFARSQGFVLDHAIVYVDHDSSGVGLAELIHEVRRTGARAVVMPGPRHLSATQLDALRAYVDVLTVHPRNRWPMRDSLVPVACSVGPVFRAGGLDDVPESCSEAQRAADQVHARVVADALGRDR